MGWSQDEGGGGGWLNEGDPNLAPTYEAQIFTYLKEKEVRLNPNQASLFGQSQDEGGGGGGGGWLNEGDRNLAPTYTAHIVIIHIPQGKGGKAIDNAFKA